MPTPKATATSRYFDPETTKCYLVPSIANLDSPTRLELNAGLDISDQIADLNGFTVSADEIETPDMGSLFTKKIGGRTSAADSSLTMYADDGGDDIRKTHPRKTVTFVCWLDGGDVPGYTMAIFPSRVRSVSVQRSTGNDPARIEWQVSITDVPHEAVIVPALS